MNRNNLDGLFGGNPGEGGSGMIRDERRRFGDGTPADAILRCLKCHHVPHTKPCDCGCTHVSVGISRPSETTLTRPTWDEYFMGIAEAVAMRGDCRRRQVGCVLVDAEHRIIGTGYNGSEPGGPSCLAGQCPRGLKTQAEVASGTGGYNDCVAVHAEANALLFARESARGATAYVTSPVCPDCSKLLKAAGVRTVVAKDFGPGVSPLALR